MTQVTITGNVKHDDIEYKVGQIVEVAEDVAHELIRIGVAVDVAAKLELGKIETEVKADAPVVPATPEQPPVTPPAPETPVVPATPTTPEAPANGGLAASATPLEPSQPESPAGSTDTPVVPAPSTDPTPEQIAADLKEI